MCTRDRKGPAGREDESDARMERKRTTGKETHQVLRRVRGHFVRVQSSLDIVLRERRRWRYAKLLLKCPRPLVPRLLFLLPPSPGRVAPPPIPLPLPRARPQSLAAVELALPLVLFLLLLCSPSSPERPLRRLALPPPVPRIPLRESPLRLRPSNAPLEVLPTEAELAPREGDAEELWRLPRPEEGIGRVTFHRRLRRGVGWVVCGGGGRLGSLYAKLDSG